VVVYQVEEVVEDRFKSFCCFLLVNCLFLKFFYKRWIQKFKICPFLCLSIEKICLAKDTNLLSIQRA